MGKTSRTNRDIAHYFEYSNHGIEVLQDGLEEVPFGEFLVAQEAVDRYQLFLALQMQDRMPGVKLGECVAALGYLPTREIERLHGKWSSLNTVEV